MTHGRPLEVMADRGGGGWGSFSKAGEPCGKVQLVFLSDSGCVRADVMTWGGRSWLRLLKVFYFRRRSSAVDECCCAGSLDARGEVSGTLVIAREGTLQNA